MAPSRLRDYSDGKQLRWRKKNRVLNGDLKDIVNQPPSPRPRPLTPPLPETKDWNSQDSPSIRPWRLSLSKRREQQFTYIQDQSALFGRLPAEIRLLIWEHYLCSQRLHIVLSNQHTWKQSHSKIIGLACSESRDYCPCSHHCWGQLARRPAGGCVEAIRHVDSQWHEEREWKFETGRVDFVPLLQTCRMM
jgi:hypothetical protein